MVQVLHTTAVVVIENTSKAVPAERNRQSLYAAGNMYVLSLQ